MATLLNRGTSATAALTSPVVPILPLGLPHGGLAAAAPAPKVTAFAAPASSSGVPEWAWAAGAGVLAIGVGFVAYRKLRGKR